MRTDVAFDTNVLLYIVDTTGKADRVECLLTDGGVVNVLVLTEATYVMQRRWKLAWPDIHRVLATLSSNTLCLPLADEAHTRGLRYAERYKLQIFDATIVAAATLAGCTTLYSEDLHDGLVIDGLTVRNPFQE